MLRTGLARAGSHISGTLRWTCRGEPSGSISYEAIMDEPGQERLELSYTRGPDEEREHVRQTVRLCHTVPHYGGKRWWMICPFRGIRVGKLYKPMNGDRFASRRAWRLGYHIQRVAARDRPFEALNRLQSKLKCTEGYEAGLYRPKGMWHRTFARHLDRYYEIEAQCDVEMGNMLSRLRGFQIPPVN